MLLQSPNFRGRGRSTGNVLKFSSEAGDGKIFWAHIPEVVFPISNSCEKYVPNVTSNRVHVSRRRKQLLQPQQSRPNMHSQALWRRLGEDYKFRRKLITRLWLQNDQHQNNLERYFLRFMTYLHWPHKTHQRNMVCIK